MLCYHAPFVGPLPPGLVAPFGDEAGGAPGTDLAGMAGPVGMAGPAGMPSSSTASSSTASSSTASSSTASSSNPPGTSTRLSSAPQGAAGLATRGRARRGSDADGPSSDLEYGPPDAAQHIGTHKPDAIKPLTGAALKFKAKPKKVPVPAAMAGPPKPTMLKASRDLLLYYCEECGATWHVDPDDVEAGMAHPEHYSAWNGDDPEYDLPRTSHRVLVVFADSIPLSSSLTWVGSCFGARSPYCENHQLYTVTRQYSLPEATAAALAMRRVITHVLAQCNKDVVEEKQAEPPRHRPVASAPSPYNLKLVIVSHSRQLVLSLSELMPMYGWDDKMRAYTDRYGMPMIHSGPVRSVVVGITKLAALGVQVQFCLAPRPPPDMAGQFDVDIRFVESDKPALPPPPTPGLEGILAEAERIRLHMIARALAGQTDEVMEQLLLEEAEALAHLDP